MASEDQAETVKNLFHPIFRNMKISSPKDLFFDQLKDLYSVESQVILTLPDLAGQAADPALRELIASHEGESLRHKQIVSAIFERHEVDPGGDVCKAMKGLIDGGNAHLAKTEDSMVRDLLLIAHCGRIEHYEIAAYDFTSSLAETLGFAREASELSAVLEEERRAARQLAAIRSELFGSSLNLMT